MNECVGHDAIQLSRTNIQTIAKRNDETCIKEVGLGIGTVNWDACLFACLG